MQDKEKTTNTVKKEKKKNPYLRMFIAGFCTCILVILVVSYVFNLGTVLVGAEYKTYKGLREDFGKYYKIVKILDEEALADYEPEEITDDILKEVVAGLDDPYAEYYTAEEYEVYKKHFQKSFIGVGLAVSTYKNTVYVYDVIKGQPASEEGIKRGDIITKIDDKKVTTSTEASYALSGEAGTEVVITVNRDGKELKFTMDRIKIENNSVEWEEYDKSSGIALIKITGFVQGTAKDLKLAVKDMKSKGYTKAIIDLRNNGGGKTNEAYKVADFLLPEGIIDIEINNKGEEKTHKSNPGDAGIEYVVLINENSASASELVAAAIQDNKGGKLIGVTSYGKGVTQKLQTFSDGSAIKFTIEEYLRPSGKKVNGVGVTPDVVLSEKVMANPEEALKAAARELK